MITTSRFVYVYCFPYNITIDDSTYRCPFKMFKVPFKTFILGPNNETQLDLDWQPDSHGMQIEGSFEPAFVEDTHVGHFNESMVSASNTVMVDRVQELMQEVDHLLAEKENSVIIQKFSATFWTLISIVSCATLGVLCFVIANLHLTRRGLSRTKKANDRFLNELNSLKAVYETVDDSDTRAALKAFLKASSKVSNNINTGDNSLNKPTVEVGGDQTVAIHVNKVPVNRELPDLPV